MPISKQNQTGFIDIDFGALIMVLLLIGGVIGAAVICLMPMAWGWVKPFIHAMTA